MGLCQLGSYTASISFAVAVILTIIVPALIMSGIPVNTGILPTLSISEMYSNLVKYALQPIPLSATQLVNFAQLATFVTLSITLTTVGLYMAVWYLLLQLAGPLAIVALPFFSILTISTGWYIAYVLTNGKIPCP